MCDNQDCRHPQHTHFMGFGRCNQTIGNVWLCGCPHYDRKDQ